MSGLRTGRRRSAAPAAILVVALLALGVIASPVRGASSRAAGTLTLDGGLRLASRLAGCAPGVTASACATRTGEGLVPGLGRVTYSYSWLATLGAPSCQPDDGRALGYAVRLVVADKGEIELAVAEGGRCVPLDDVRTQTQRFTVTGGTGVYQGASGSGTVDRTLGEPTASGARVGRETWKGTLVVPSLEFDLTPPTLSGGVSRTVRVKRGTKRVRATYAVTARDDADGVVPVSCSPRSGSRFPIGRTVVSCSATDTSGNTGSARFAVTVAHRR